MISKPQYLLPDHMVYLDLLQQLGSTNMLGAGPYLTQQFPDTLSATQAQHILEYWMQVKQREADYDLIDRYLRTNLDDADYAEFSTALTNVWNHLP